MLINIVREITIDSDHNNKVSEKYLSKENLVSSGILMRNTTSLHFCGGPYQYDFFEIMRASLKPPSDFQYLKYRGNHPRNGIDD